MGIASHHVYSLGFVLILWEFNQFLILQFKVSNTVKAYSTIATARCFSLTLGQLQILQEIVQPSGTFVCQLPFGGSCVILFLSFVLIVIVVFIAANTFI